jgi:hypothetical protein
LIARPGKGLLTPWKPLDRIVGVLEKVGTALAGKVVHRESFYWELQDCRIAGCRKEIAEGKLQKGSRGKTAEGRVQIGLQR